MRTARLVLREVAHRRTSFALSLVAVVVAVALMVVTVQLGRAAEQETRVIQRDLGLNVLVLPAATDLDRYWSLGYSEHSMPADHLQRLADQEVANRLIPLLRRRVSWRGMEVMLTGIAGELFQGGRTMKPVFGMNIAPGELVLGGAVARHLDLGPGSGVQLLGQPFRVERTLAELGSEEDVTVYARLQDVQGLLDLEGRINEIRALECHCEEDAADPLAVLRAQLEPLLPGTQVIRRTRAADARRRQRLLAEGSLAASVPLVLALCALAVAALAAQNARERRAEVGILAALGHGGGRVAALFLGRALLLGVAGALVGVLLGDGLARWAASSLLRFADGALQSDGKLWLWALVLAPALTALASLAPALAAARRDPAEVLRGE